VVELDKPASRCDHAASRGSSPQSSTAARRRAPAGYGIAAIAAGEREVGEELGNALIEDRAVVAAGFVAER
jgi:hypothetical protein